MGMLAQGVGELGELHFPQTAFCCPPRGISCSLKTPVNHKCQLNTKCSVVHGWVFHPGLVLTVFFLLFIVACGVCVSWSRHAPVK